jgi:hypothetical protein
MVKACYYKKKKFEYEPQQKITIGSDPELSFAKGRPMFNNFYSADNFLSTDYDDELGCDGNSCIAEIRPPAEDCPLKHTDNIKKIMKELAKEMLLEDEKLEEEKKLECYAGNGFCDSTGGHIHFGIFLDKDNNIRLINLLDMMSIFLMPLEDTSNAKKRRNGDYGQLGNFETKDYGFEYRTLGSWLYSEKDTQSILCLGYTLAYEFMNNRETSEEMMEDFEYHFGGITGDGLDDYGSNDLDIDGEEFNLNFGIDDEYEGKRNDTIKHFNSCEVNYFAKSNFNFYEFFMDKVRKMIKYNDYKEHIERLFTKFNKREKFNETKGIITSWNVGDIQIEHPKRPLFCFQNKDYFKFDEIQEKIPKKILQKEMSMRNKKGLLLYGLKSDREIDFGTNNRNVYNLLKKFSEENQIKLRIKMIGNYTNDGLMGLGIGYKIRKENLTLIKKAIGYLAKSITSKDMDGIKLYKDRKKKE